MSPAFESFCLLRAPDAFRKIPKNKIVISHSDTLSGASVPEICHNWPFTKSKRYFCTLPKFVSCEFHAVTSFCRIIYIEFMCVPQGHASTNLALGTASFWRLSIGATHIQHTTRVGIHAVIASLALCRSLWALAQVRFRCRTTFVSHNTIRFCVKSEMCCFAECVDRDPRCQRWAAEKRCGFSPDMQYICMKSCNFCPPCTP